MNFILYIKIVEQQEFVFENPLAVLQSEGVNADFLDLDNFSDPALLEHSYRALKEAGKICVVFDIRTEKDSARFLQIATYLADHAQKARVYIIGQDKVLCRLLPASEGFVEYIPAAGEAVAAIRSFIAGEVE
jgi:hypothetical protein